MIERNFGKGKIIWSGFNLFYHYNQYKVADEAKLLINILNEFTSTEAFPLVSSEVEWIKPEKVTVSTKEKPKGVLFKMQGYEGWSAKATSDGNRNLPIYLAGPSFPGFMYVSTQNLPEEPLALEFSYSDPGAFWRINIVSLVTVLVLLDLIITKGTITRFLLSPVLKIGKKKMKGWWEKEDEV